MNNFKAKLNNKSYQMLNKIQKNEFCQKNHQLQLTQHKYNDIPEKFKILTPIHEMIIPIAVFIKKKFNTIN